MTTKNDREIAEWRRNPNHRKFEFDTTYLRTRTINALKAEGVFTLHELVNYSATKLLRVPGIGHTGLARINDMLAVHGLQRMKG